ncbi:MAG: hypothetical protein EOS32_28810 [Mesorhizobium sp.]|uniref:hypothetical protein n=1 Tax=Mesorhizobium sp. TaxID=1871066 RepID=UPI000FE774E8|nr:hypothetical protein [Mesorhizobium sp.]RWC90052.1 MAG: hypothetical protein EOS32_28810 [Mesorhizobium sp.]
MAARAAPFRQVDVTRAIKAAASAGMKVGRVEIDATGRIVVVAAGQTPEPANDLDKWMASHAG